LNLPKSVFSIVFVAWLAQLSVYGLIQLARGMEPLLSWIGLLLNAMGPLLFFTRELLFKTPRTFRHPLGYSVLCGLGLAMTMAMSFRHGPAAGHLHVWAGITLIGWIAYLRWFSGAPGN
jgi:hypothetical protein